MKDTLQATRPAVLAAGVVLWRRAPVDGTPAAVEIALVHRPRYDDWSFPKGKVDRGESMPAAAVRETREETGFVARLGALLGDVHYDVLEGPKLVRYWSAEARGGEFPANAETDELRWVSPAEAAGLLSYRHDVTVLERFTAAGPPDSVVVLVRHAKAGNRLQWDGDDDLRPLSGSGREQARHLVGLLSLFGPDRIVSAPPVRCRDTVVPLADALRLPISIEPLLGEEGYWDAPEAGRARFRELAAQSGVTVVSSQGGVIPAVVESLVTSAPRDLGVDPDDIGSRKASTWVLGFTGSALQTADYYPHPTG